MRTTREKTNHGTASRHVPSRHIASSFLRAPLSDRLTVCLSLSASHLPKYYIRLWGIHKLCKLLQVN